MRKLPCIVLLGVMSGVSLGQASPPAARNVWIANDRVADCRSIPAMGATFGNAYTPSGVVAPASDQDKAINCYNNHKRRCYHWGNLPPNGPGVTISDPVYALNVFGWGLCFNLGPQGATIAKAAGLDGRRIDLMEGSTSVHTIYEVYYGTKWHLMDTMTTMYVFDRGNPAQIASADDIKADGTLITGAVAQGRACPGFLLCGDDPGWFALAVRNYVVTPGGIITNNWSMDMDLRWGETFKRTWEHWVNQHPPIPAAPSPQDPPYHHEASRDWKDTVNYPYWEPYKVVMPVYWGGTMNTYRRWSNGTDTLAPDFRSGSYQSLLHSQTNIATFHNDGLTPDLHAAVAGQPAEAVFRVKLPFYITDASLSGDFYRHDSGDSVKVYVSTNGTTWVQAWTTTADGTSSLAGLSLRSHVFGKFEYFLKIQVNAAGAINEAGVSNLVLSTTFEHNKGAMAYLDRGVNHITVTLDNPAELQANYVGMKVTYRWKEFDGTDWTIARSHEQIVTASPYTYTVTVGGTKVPRTESIQMELVTIRRYPGDINGDNHVDVVDLLTLAASWGKASGEAGYDPACDLDSDGSVDVVDLLMLAEDWGM